MKTLLEGGSSSWLLFVYTADCPETELGDCNEGKLEWVSTEKLSSYNLIGFIGAILPQILSEHVSFEGTIVHDLGGEVVSIQLRLAGEPDQPLVATDQMASTVDSPMGRFSGESSNDGEWLLCRANKPFFVDQKHIF